ncbi:hypothetical protein [Embleya sp. NBC_00896]|uniref:hypothetical protein n=1 Tax=Embleya sp. NBC_00896 TaxID=2975961 RepID=UPI0038644073|nr:hypothetical protein OG928_14715 [Embleya sp. NBC_00896]
MPLWGVGTGRRDPEPKWLYRFWDWNHDEAMWFARELAYASAMAGAGITTGTVVSGPPRRWVEIPEGSPLSER